MCGRYQLLTKFINLPDLLKKDVPRGLSQNYEPQILIKPGSPILVLKNEGKTQTSIMLWGFISEWSKDPFDNTRPKPFNARSESVEEKKLFSVVGGYFQGLTKGEGNVYLYAISKEKKDSNEIDKIIMNEFKKIINEKLTSERFEIEKKKYFFDTIYKKDGVLNPAQIYGEALTVGLTFDDINKWQERLNNISLNDVKKALEKLYENKNYVIGELSN